MSYRGNRGGGGRSGGGYGSGGYRGGGSGDRFGGSMSMGPKPVEVGKEYDVDIAELSRRGDGVAKVQGFIVFVRGSKVGEKVRIKVETVGPRFATASVVGGSSDSGGAESSSGSSVAEPVS